MLTLLDGVVAGEGEGPLAPRDVPLGAVLAATDPIALDLAALRLMGFDERKHPEGPRADGDRDAARDGGARARRRARVRGLDGDARPRERRARRDRAAERVFEPHPGWRGHVEREPR